MKPVFRFLFMCSFLLLFSSQAVAADEATQDSPFSKSGSKLLSGAANVATGWMELPKNIFLAGQQKETPASGVIVVTLGVFQGVWYTINRTGCGVFDLITFMFPAAPSVDPAFVWNDFSKESKFMGTR